ncbi:uncharacterized protein BT62DRAFT_1002340 [Guyanagaster necrorhizus]|uniref:Uncharacterized protein n=1 Tax=Guyanagaster necrorhizus TaxID=856835 RepID=A0A9P7VZW0_9AGAR|nr:uncharacterized protein BT62DRAFT_1002340 [Guyanagaster necrorhizus MCA 3950]KAG7450009.1 hypothetical protein BT62DRAFT_1002340 [Guyanagaster necrorhizus MCA 3950]
MKLERGQTEEDQEATELEIHATEPQRDYIVSSEPMKTSTQEEAAFRSEDEFDPSDLQNADDGLLNDGSRSEKPKIASVPASSSHLSEVARGKMKAVRRPLNDNYLAQIKSTHLKGAKWYTITPSPPTGFSVFYLMQTKQKEREKIKTRVPLAVTAKDVIEAFCNGDTAYQHRANGLYGSKSKNTGKKNSTSAGNKKPSSKPDGDDKEDTSPAALPRRTTRRRKSSVRSRQLAGKEQDESEEIESEEDNSNANSNY